MEQIIKLLIFFMVLKFIIDLILPSKKRRKYKRNTQNKNYRNQKPTQTKAYFKEKTQRPFKQNYENNKENKTKKDEYKETKKLETLLKNIEENTTTKKEKPINMNETAEDKTNNLYSHLYKKKSKKEIFEESRKERYKKHIKETKIKGDNYEIFIGEYYKKLGYKIIQNGIIKGKKDNTIDVIAQKENELIYIQCKDWEYNKKWLINHEKIKSFVGDTYIFTENNPKYKNYKIKRLFIASKDIFNRSAKHYCKENRSIVEYKIIPM